MRLGVVSFLNSRPLAWGLSKGSLRGRHQVEYCPPAAVAEGLRNGRFDAGLIPSIEARRIPGLTLVPGLCIAATEEVRSVLLVSRGPLSEVRRVALDENSRTSAALVRLLLAERGLSPEYVPARADLATMLELADAALVIGDPALFADRAGVQVLDLASEWHRLTGLPFVFAVWAARTDCDVAALAADLEASYHEGLEALPRIVAEAEADSGLPRDVLETYFTRNLSYRLGEPERAGLAEFYRRAAAHGLIPEPYQPVPA